MTEATTSFIAFSWIGWLVYWLMMASGTKRTVSAEGPWGGVAALVAVVVGIAGAGRVLPVSRRAALWHGGGRGWPAPEVAGDRRSAARADGGMRAHVGLRGGG